MTQAAFAKRLGVSASYVQRIELGQLLAPSELCRKIAILTGADPTTLMRKRGRPRTLEGGPFNAESIAKWQSKAEEPGAQFFDLFTVQHLLVAVAALGSAAREKGRLRALLVSFQPWLQQVVADFGIQEAFDRQLAERAQRWNNSTAKIGSPLRMLPPTADILLSSALSCAEIEEARRRGEVADSELTAAALHRALKSGSVSGAAY